MLVFKSPDGLHWTPIAGAPVLTDGAFDSQNHAFWDPTRGEYRAYWRYFSGNNEGSGGLNPAGVRAIRTAVSKDLVHWGPSENLRYVDPPAEQLYTNTVAPYERAPHILIGLPARYADRGWSESLRELPGLEHRLWRAKQSERLGTAVTDSLFMASCDADLYAFCFQP